MNADTRLIRKTMIIAFFPLIIIVFLFLPRSIQHAALTIVLIYALFLTFKAVMNMLLFLTIRKRAADRASQTDGLLYSDNLIYIDDNGLTIRLFYFPLGSKRIRFSDIETVTGFKGSYWRLWGTGDFRTWFGFDEERMDRPMRFIIRRKDKWSRIGFTCENPEAVIKILQDKGLYQTK